MFNAVHGSIRRATLAGLVIGWLGGVIAVALPPAPANDDPNNAAPIVGPLPMLIYGTSVLANDSVSTIPSLPAIDAYVDGPDVFYSFTPDATATYRFQLIPWQTAPLRSSDRRFTLYVLDGAMLGVDGIRAAGSARPVALDVALTMGEQYLLGIDHDDSTYDNFEFTLIVDKLNLTNPDDCGLYENLSADLPSLRLNNIDGAANDFNFVQGAGRCGVSGTPTTADGIDHVYKFTPTTSGDYAMELVVNGFDGVLYVNETCPPDPNYCLGASNHSTSGTSGGKHELVVVTLTAGVEYYVYVDNGSTSNLSGEYALIIDDAFNYEINEIEPNDDPNAASPLGTPLNGGQLVGPEDVDYWAVEGNTGDRVYAWVNNGGSSNSTLDTDLAFLAADGLTLIEFDDEDGDGAAAPINDWHYVYSTTSAVIAGARLTSDATHYLVVTDQSATGTVSRYRFHTGVIPAEWTPTPELEGNDDLGTANLSGKNYWAGVIPTVDDADFFRFEATAGDRIFVAFDGDPERDSTGFDSANTDPLAFHGKLVIYDPAGDILISDVSDSNTIQSGPDYPAQGGFFIARTTGTHYVEVRPQSTLSQTGPTETYELAVFINEQSPALAEANPPDITLVPDFGANTIAVTATDNEPNDTGICSVTLSANTNLQITNLAGLNTGVATFDIELVDPNMSGTAALVVFDCAGNLAAESVKIDIDPPTCDGVAFSKRTPTTLDGPLYVPDNDPNGLDVPFVIGEAGTITDVNLSATFECTATSDLDIYLTSPNGTTVEVQTDRGSSLAFDIIDATWDDDADEIMPILSGDEPYTGTWLPEGVLADLNGGPADGTWILNVRDDSSSQNGGSRIVYATLEITATFSAPQTYAGTASDVSGIDAGIASIVLVDPNNVQLNLPPGFTPGDPIVEYTITLIDASQDGSATVVVTDMQDNTCMTPITLNGAVDTTDPANTGGVTTSLTYTQEVQADIPSPDPVGVTSTLIVPESFLVGEVTAELVIDTKDLGRLASTLSKGVNFASLVNRVGMDDRDSVGLTKNTIWVTLDDNAPVEDDAHNEPALGTIPFIGLHQPDGRGEFIGNGIATDNRDNMMFALANQSAAGPWKAFAGDFRALGSTRSTFRRWALTLDSPCGPERYVGQARDLVPGAGIDTITLDGGAVNLQVIATFAPGDEVVDYRVELIDPNLPGAGDVLIADIAGNVTTVPVALNAAAADQAPPAIGGSYDPNTLLFSGTASDDVSVELLELAPYADNLTIVSVTPALPASSVDYVIGLADPNMNGRGYVRVTDSCGWRSHVLVEIDGIAPECTGEFGRLQRYFSTDGPLPLPDNDTAVGVSTSISVADTGTITDADITFNITHGYDDDIDMTLTSPASIALLSDIGSTGNDFIDTTLDDEAAAPIPDSSTAAPFTGSYQPEGGPALFALDGLSTAGTYTLKIVDDKVNDTGTYDSWSLKLAADEFLPAYDGRATETALRDSGICSIALLPGASNLVLTIDPTFTAGDAIARYTVALDTAMAIGTGTLAVTDCTGNACLVDIFLPDFAVGDVNCDGAINFGDIDPFVLAITDAVAYEAAYPDCDRRLADINGDGAVNFGDIDPFVALITGP